MADQGGLGDETKDLAHDEQSEKSTATAFGMPGTAAETEGKAEGETEGEAAGESAADEQIDAANLAANGSVGL